MRELLRDIEFSKNNKLYVIANKLLEIDKDLKEKKSYIDKLIEDSEISNLQSKFRVEYNSQSYASFYNTKIEKDKSILTLSVAGLGFLVTFINFTENLKLYEFILFIISAVCFMICIYKIINIFDKNAEYIILLTTDAEGIDDKEIELKRLDQWAIKSFYLGLVMAFTLGMCTSLTNLNKKVENDGKKELGTISINRK